VHGEALGATAAAEGVEEAAGPIGIVAVGSQAILLGPDIAEGPDIGGELAVLGAVLFGVHVAAAAPVFVADTQYLTLKGPAEPFLARSSERVEPEG